MKMFISFLLLSLQVQAAVPAKKFTCSFSKFPKEKFTFTVKNFEQKKMDLMYTDSVRGPFRTNSKIQEIQGIVDSLNARGGILRKRNYGIQLFGEQIGCDYVWINLEKNKGYKVGSVKAEYQCSDRSVFRDKVFCTVK